MLPAYGSRRVTAVDMLSCASFGGSASFAYPAGVMGGSSAGWAWSGWFWPFSLSARDLSFLALTNSPQFGYSAGGLIQFKQQGSSYLSSGVAFPAKTWVHGSISVTPLAGNVGYDWAIYQFGELVASGRQATGNFVAYSSAPAGVLGSGSRLGRQTWWDRAITQAEARAHYYESKAAGAAADWWVDAGEGAVSADAVTALVGKQMTVTLGSGGAWSTDTPLRAAQVSQPFGSVLLPGIAGSRLATADGAALPQLVGATGLTLLAWHRTRSALGTDQGALISARSGTSPGALHFQLNGFNGSQIGQARVAFNDTLRSSGTQAITTEPIPARGRWRMSGASFDRVNNLIRTYNNGLQTASTAAAFNGSLFSIGSPPPADFTSLALGEDVGGAIPYSGWLGPCRVFDVVLTNRQIRDVFLKGTCDVRPAFEWLLNERVGTMAASTGKYAATATMGGTAAWSLDQPW